VVSTFDTRRIMDRIDMPSKIEVDTRRFLPREVRNAPVPLGPDIVLGRALWLGVPYLVVATRLDRPWPGTDRDVTFAVQKLHQNPAGVWESHTSWGFFEERECWEFLTGRDSIRFQVWDLNGVPSIEWRQCLGVPEGATDRAGVVKG